MSALVVLGVVAGVISSGKVGRVVISLYVCCSDNHHFVVD